MAAAPIITVIREGDTSKPHPFTVCVVANPVLEAPWQSGQFIRDPIVADQDAFNGCVRYIDTALFGNLPNQRERFLADPAIQPHVREISLFVADVPVEDPNSLVGQDSDSNLLVARRNHFRPFLERYGLEADVAYAVSASASHTRASAWLTTDDDSRPGVAFLLDGVRLWHRYDNLVPGTIAIHASAESLTALHEFCHALSSYSNGKIVDLYVDNNPAVNCKRGRPIPPIFADYDGNQFRSDLTRDTLGYPAHWQSYPCELHDPSYPAVMDNYWQSPDGVPEHCQHDVITRRFLSDRIRAKITR